MCCERKTLFSLKKQVEKYGLLDKRTGPLDQILFLSSMVLSTHLLLVLINASLATMPSHAVAPSLHRLATFASLYIHGHTSSRQRMPVETGAAERAPYASICKREKKWRKGNIEDVICCQYVKTLSPF
jgi:hypothetical protein